MSSDFNDDFSDIEFAENPDPRCPIMFVLDCSDSMTQDFGDGKTPLQELDGGLDILVSEVRKDDLSKRRAEFSFLPYGREIGEPTPFATVDGNLSLPSLKPMGITNTGAALEKALDKLEERKQEYKKNGISYYQSMLFLISDGLSMDSLDNVSARIKELESKKKISFFAIGVAGADVDELSTIGSRQALMLRGMKFAELFQWISASAASVSASQVGDKVGLENPAGWAEL